MSKSAAQPLELRAQELGATLPALLVAAERVAAVVWQGVHGRRRVGPGETFWQFRPYQSGDAAQAVDWRQSARTDRLFVREREWSVTQTVWLWYDSSPSMAWSSHPNLPQKRERSQILLLALAGLLLRGGERVGLLGDVDPPSWGRPTLSRLGRTVERGDLPHAGGLPPPAALTRHATIVLIGDFLSPLPMIEERLRAIAAAGLRGHLLQVLDPAEEALPFEGRIRFEGMEGEGSLVIRRAEDIRQAYVERLAEHRAGLADLTRGLGWSFATHRTDVPPQVPLLALHGLLAANSRGW